MPLELTERSEKNQTGEENQAHEDNQGEKDQSEEEESDEVPSATQREINKFTERLVAMGEMWIEEFNDYRGSMRTLHDENKQILEQLKALAQRQEM